LRRWQDTSLARLAGDAFEPNARDPVEISAYFRDIRAV
jgi:hypothetical protein